MRDSDIHMMQADYTCDVTVTCRTCDVVGRLTAVGSLRVQQLARKHSTCDVSIDVTNVQRKRVPRGWSW